MKKQSSFFKLRTDNLDSNLNAQNALDQSPLNNNVNFTQPLQIINPVVNKRSLGYELLMKRNSPLNGIGKNNTIIENTSEYKVSS